ncbi:hypothetical protein [Neomegalonema perideroedes]|uniref:hypothetical protein n=1 Tax=Neomegalonema perideroedes TaxID=217219 RepID=UPI00035F4691|nr:hypothetical protein [Neomegalonema perideroedes]
MSFGLLQMFVVTIGGWIFLSDFKKRPEFRQLPESRWWRRPGLLTVVGAWSRRDDDPLKPAHQALARYVLIVWGLNLLSIAMLFADPPSAPKPKPEERVFSIDRRIAPPPAQPDQSRVKIR